MLQIRRYSLFAMLVMAFSCFSACTEDQQPAEAVAQGDAAGQIPAEPPLNDANSKSFAPETVYFDFDSDVISAEGQRKLAGLAEHLKAGKMSLQVEGHCDERGSTVYNLALGERRAHAVKRYLVQLGVEAGRVSTISYGEEKPAVEGHDESAWSQNRRAEFTLSE